MTPEEDGMDVLEEAAYLNSTRRSFYESSTLTGTVFDALEVRLIEGDDKLTSLYKEVLKKTLEAKKLNAEQTIRAMKEQEQRIRVEQSKQGIQHGQNAGLDEF